MDSDLSHLVFLSRYANHGETKYEDAVRRTFDMHRRRLTNWPDASLRLDAIERAVVAKEIFPSGRSLQCGGPGIERVNLRMFNCAGVIINSPEFFYKSLYLLLCGSGVGASVLDEQVSRLPSILERSTERVVHTVEDSIEGWALSLRALMSSYFCDQGIQADENRLLDDSKYRGCTVVFDYGCIRPQGSKISNVTGTAPGPDPLRIALDHIDRLLQGRSGQRLRPIDCLDILCHAADCVVAGGVRRSAMLVLFSAENVDMVTCKTGDWFRTNPQRARANISALVSRSAPRQVLHDLLQSTRQFGEPGVVFGDNPDMVVNPCAEVTLLPYHSEQARYGVQLCNLTEVNVAVCSDEATFLRSCTLAAQLGTIQAMYDDFSFLGATTELIMARSRLLGVSLTGIMLKPEIGLNGPLLQLGSEAAVTANRDMARLLGINSAERTTCVKPSGTASLVLGHGAAGIHPPHAKQYIRRVQCSPSDEIALAYRSARPFAYEKSAWSSDGGVLSFACTAEGMVKEDLSAIAMLEAAQRVQCDWVQPGTQRGKEVHSVSLTVSVGCHEWEQVEEYLYENSTSFQGVSLLADDGDVLYRQAPFEQVLSAEALVQQFGPSALFASGLIVALKEVFGSLHEAIDFVNFGQRSPPSEPTKHSAKDSVVAVRNVQRRVLGDRLLNFANRFSDGDMKMAQACLLRVDGLYQYLKLSSLDSPVSWPTPGATLGHGDCSGGSCHLEHL